MLRVLLLVLVSLVSLVGCGASCADLCDHEAACFEKMAGIEFSADDVSKCVSQCNAEKCNDNAAVVSCLDAAFVKCFSIDQVHDDAIKCVRTCK